MYKTDGRIPAFARSHGKDVMTSAIVTDYLSSLIAKQVEEHGLVVWYDPEQAYTAAALNWPATTLARYDGSFFQLRQSIDHLLNGRQPPRLVVYVPLERADTHAALVELEAAGVIMQPGQQPPNRNTRLAIVARHALRPILGEVAAADIEKQLEAGKLSLADLNRLAEKSKELSTGVLALIFGNANPQDVALAFLDRDQYDGAIEQKSARGELFTLLQTAYDIALPPELTLAEARHRLARHILLTELIQQLGDTVPAPLAAVTLAATTSEIDACLALARHWRLRRDTRDSYVAAANRVEHEFALGRLAFDPQRLREIDTFLTLERALLREVETSLYNAAEADLFQFAQARLSRFWSEVLPSIQARWALIAAAAEVLLEADRLAQALKSPPVTVPALVAAYTEGDAPWCRLDTCHRRLESRWHHFEPESGDDSRYLEKLVIKAEQRYAAIGSALARHFTTQFSKAKQPIPGLLRQRDIYETQVKPKLMEGAVAYLWVDALRFEMARELDRLLQDDFATSLQPALATIPTITEIGMAALLPRAHQSAKVVAVGNGKLGLEIENTTIKDRKDRIAFLRAQAGVTVFETKLDELLPKPSKKTREGIQHAQLILVTSQEIDELCEQDNIAQARLQMDSLLRQLRRGVRVLSDLGVKTLILAADHGHLFADELSEDMKIDPPRGRTEDLHRRVWVGIGGASDPAYLRTPLASLGVDSELDIATPWNFACFKAKGGTRAYFHGGVSLQELIIPVLVMTPTAAVTDGALSRFEWTLTPGSAKLTTRFFSVQVAGKQSQSSLFGLAPPTVRVELRANKQIIATPVSASYGFEDATGEVTLKAAADNPTKIEPNTITLMLTEEIGQHTTVGVRLLDAASGAELARHDSIAVAIAL